MNSFSAASESRRPGWPSCLAGGFLFAHAVVLAWISLVNSPNVDEPGHLVSGLCHWQLGRFEPYRVNPPLIRMIAAVPAFLLGARTDWSTESVEDVYSRAEFPLGKQFVDRNGAKAFDDFRLARWMLIPLSVLGGWICYRWAFELYGAKGGLVSVVLYSFCPQLLAWGSSITPDAAAGSLGLIAGYAFWRWLRKPGWGAAIAAGTALGVAELTKTTWVLLFILWPVLFQFWKRNAASAEEQKVSPSLRQLAAILLIGIYFINLGYAFDGSFKRLRDYRFISRSLSGEDHPRSGANRFTGWWIASVPVPLPENYVRGIDVQRYDFEQGKWSYLRGEQRRSGWWYYYLYALLVKTPMGTLALGAIAFGTLACGRQRMARLRDEVVLLAPAMAVLVLVSSQTGFSRYLRYVVPAIPLAYVALGRVAVLFERGSRFAAATICLLVVAAVTESLSVVPHSLAFFNCAAGGPLRGDAHLVDSNIDWGQDLLHLKRWLDSHPEARPVHLAYFNDFHVAPEAAGIESQPVPRILPEGHPKRSAQENESLQPGWYAVSVNWLRGYRHLDQDEPVYMYFQKFEPVARAGYSICIFHVTPGEASEFAPRLVTE